MDALKWSVRAWKLLNDTRVANTPNKKQQGANLSQINGQSR